MEHVKLNLSQLAPCSHVARIVQASEDEDRALLESIRRHGLLENLIVARRDGLDGVFEVVAGQRRLAAIRQLNKSGDWDGRRKVQCLALDDDALPAEISLAENYARAQMSAYDEIMAFKSLEVAGGTPEMIARRFGITERKVRQRLRLADVAPPILEEYRDGQLSLDVLRAYALTADQDRQLQVHSELQGGGYHHEYSVRNRLTDAMHRSDGKLAKFVGVTEYEEAGGSVMRDLFSESDGYFWLQDSTLLNKLATAKLNEEAEKLTADGWKFALAVPDYTYDLRQNFDRIDVEIEPEGADLEKLDALDERIGQANQRTMQAKQGSDEYRAAMDDWDEADDEREEFVDELEQKALEAHKGESGCVVTINHAGEIEVHRGLVRESDERPGTENDASGPAETGKKDWPLSLYDDLRHWRGTVIRAQLASNPDLAFDLAAYEMACSLLSDTHVQKATNIGASYSDERPLNRKSVADYEDWNVGEKDLAEQWVTLDLAWLEERIEDRFAAFCNLESEEKNRIFAYCVAQATKNFLLKDGWKPRHYETVVDMMEVDFSRFSPDPVHFLKKLSVEQIAAVMAKNHGPECVAAVRTMKKGEAVQYASTALRALVYPYIPDCIGG